MITPEHIELSIKKATDGETYLSQSIYDIRGFSTRYMRNLFHHICNVEGGCTYLEIGLFCGGTFVSSFNKNTISIGIENHSQDFSEGFEVVKKELKENIDNHSELAKEIHVHYEDCFKIDKSKLPDNIDIFCYDGHHDEMYQEAALPHFIEKMANTFVMIVDDWSWDSVFNGTNKAISSLSDKINVEQFWALRGYSLHNDPVWHNSIGIFLINKK